MINENNPTQNLPATLPPAFNVLAKPTGPLCNLDCKYCFYLEKENLYPGKTKWTMPDDVLESFIKQKIEAHRTEQVSFAWQGGEPTLLGVPFFQKVVDLQQKYANGKQIHNAFQTNGVLIDDEWCEFLNKHEFLIGLSIDGPRELHDYYRVTKGDKATFDKVVRGIEFMKKHKVEYNTLTVLNDQNAKHPLDVYNFLKEIGSGFMQFIPIAERIADDTPTDGLALVKPTYDGQAQVAGWSVDPLDFGNFMISVFEEWVRKDVGEIFVQFFDTALESWYGMEPNLCLFRKTCGDALAIEHNGDIFSCDHFVFPENKLGNILKQPLAEMIASEQQRQFGRDKAMSLPKYCRGCEVLFACRGECPKNRFTKTPEGEDGLNYLCAGYRKFFNHIDPYMRFMAQELQHGRPPANVMAWVKEKDRGFPSAQIGRNDPCPCGSGKKFKKCCGEKRA